MGSVGACRQCAVKQFHGEDDKHGRMVMACMIEAADGTRISIGDPEAVKFRASVIEWLMTNHPHDCPVCEEGGECHLQDMTLMTGHAYRRYRFKKRTFRNQYLGPFITHEMNRCIACYRCVRFYREYAGGRDFDVFAAHNHVYFGRHEDGVLESEFSGNLAEVCPTGVFDDKPFAKVLRPQMGSAWHAVGLRALRARLQHNAQRTLRHSAAYPQPLQRRGERLLPLRSRQVWLRLRQQPSAFAPAPPAKGRQWEPEPATKAEVAAPSDGVAVIVQGDRHRLAARLARGQFRVARIGRRRALPSRTVGERAGVARADHRHPAARSGARRLAQGRRAGRCGVHLGRGRARYRPPPRPESPAGGPPEIAGDRRPDEDPAMAGRGRAQCGAAGKEPALHRHAGCDAARRRGDRHVPRRARRSRPAWLCRGA